MKRSRWASRQLQAGRASSKAGIKAYRQGSSGQVQADTGMHGTGMHANKFTGKNQIESGGQTCRQAHRQQARKLAGNKVSSGKRMQAGMHEGR